MLQFDEISANGDFFLYFLSVHAKMTNECALE